MESATGTRRRARDHGSCARIFPQAVDSDSECPGSPRRHFSREQGPRLPRVVSIAPGERVPSTRHDWSSRTVGSGLSISSVQEASDAGVSRRARLDDDDPSVRCPAVLLPPAVSAALLGKSMALHSHCRARAFRRQRSRGRSSLGTEEHVPVRRHRFAVPVGIDSPQDKIALFG